MQTEKQKAWRNRVQSLWRLKGIRLNNLQGLTKEEQGCLVMANEYIRRVLTNFNNNSRNLGFKVKEE